MRNRQALAATTGAKVAAERRVGPTVHSPRESAILLGDLSSMKKTTFGGVSVVLAALAMTVASASQAQEPAAPAPQTPAGAPGETWYYRSSPEREPTFTVAQLKAQQRGAQRMARLEASRWYGMSNSRPTATPMPWSTMYSPAWQMPGGRPFAWYVSHRPVVIITQPTPLYR